MYLEVPVNALYKFQSFYVGAGPYAAFALGGKTKAEGKMTEDDVTISVDGERDLESVVTRKTMTINRLTLD